MKTSKILLILALIALVLGISSCGPQGPDATAGKNYFTGYDSIDLEFVGDNPPSIFYYDTRPPRERDNNFDIIVKMHNKGALISYATLYITGYDRKMIDVAGESALGGNRGSYSFHSSPDGGTISLTGFFSGRIGGPGQGGIDLIFHTPAGDVYGSTRGPVGSGYALTDWQYFISFDVPGYELLETMAQRFADFYHTLNARSLVVLAGDNRYYPGGESEILYFPGYVYELPEGVEGYNPTFLVKACYDYVTRASPVVCIDPFPQSNAEKVCRPHTVSLSGGQGAPVAITRVEQASSPSKIVFTIHVEHRGDGIIYDYKSANKCDPDSGLVVKPTDLDVVYLERISLSGEYAGGSFRCNPTSKAIRLINGKGYIHCEYYPHQDYFGATSAYEAPLFIELWYYYGKYMTKKMTIKKI
jgi:hypothetical protein